MTESFKRFVFEITLSIIRALRGVDITVTSFGGNVLSFDLSREETSGERVVDNNVQAIALATRNELRLDRPSWRLSKTSYLRPNKDRPTNGIIHSLVDGRSDPSSLLTHDHYLSDLKGRIVAQAQVYKLSFFMHFVHLL